MISGIYVEVPCPCRQTHRLPVDPVGAVSWSCNLTGASYKLQLNREAFARLQLSATPGEAEVAAEGVCAVHVADERIGPEQRCADCGVMLADYRALSRVRGRKSSFRWWLPGALVGITKKGRTYLAREPMSPGRERRCYDTGKLN